MSRTAMTTCTGCAADLDPQATFCGLCGLRTRVRRDSAVGRVLDGKYRIDAKIAAGGFGAVYRATHVASGDVVALKVLHADLAADPSLAARFKREGLTLASLRDAHTVATRELGEAADGTLYIAMELLLGESLLDRMRVRGPLPWRGVLSILRGICSSLGEAHRLGVVHRDLKPGNIHLDPSAGDFVKVLDFGVAKVLPGSGIDDGSELTRVGQAIGTVEYMAPEQLVGGACDARADLYALGVLAYEMLTGRRPFADATGPTSLVTALLTQTPPPPSSLVACGPVAGELDALVMRCLEREPGDRFGTVGELVLVIDPLLGGRALAAPPVAWVAPDLDEPTWIDVVHPLPEAACVDGPDRFVTNPTIEAPRASGASRGVGCIFGWALGLLVGGAGLGMIVATLV